MTWLPRGTRVWICPRPTRLNKSFAGLAALVQGELGGDLVSGDLFLFISKDRKLLKALRWDGSGLVLLSKRLARGKFAKVFQPDLDGVIRVSRRDLDALLLGIDITREESWRT